MEYRPRKYGVWGWWRSGRWLLSASLGRAQKLTALRAASRLKKFRRKTYLFPHLDSIKTAINRYIINAVADLGTRELAM